MLYQEMLGDLGVFLYLVNAQKKESADLGFHWIVVREKEKGRSKK